MHGPRPDAPSHNDVLTMDSVLSFAATKMQPPRSRRTRLARPQLEIELGQK